MRLKMTVLLGAIVAAQLPGFANDVDKVLDKAVGIGKKQLLKQVLNKAKDTATTPAASTAAATPPAAGAATPPAATAATPAAAKKAEVSKDAAPATNAASASATAPAAKPSLSDKVKGEAVKQATKYGTKYGSKYLKQGESELGKLLK